MISFAFCPLQQAPLLGVLSGTESRLAAVRRGFDGEAVRYQVPYKHWFSAYSQKPCVIPLFLQCGNSTISK